jgi:hypothetical protein
MKYFSGRIRTQEHQKISLSQLALGSVHVIILLKVSKNNSKLNFLEKKGNNKMISFFLQVKKKPQIKIYIAK